jgi:type IV fimbrial biogenesis protein FimT
MGIQSKGFTIVELLTGVAILAITMALAGPSFVTMIKDNRIDSATSEFVGALQLAKAESASRTRPVSVCKSNTTADGCNAGGEWTQGWLVFADIDGDGLLDGEDTLILVREALHEQITFGGTAGVDEFITFFPSGTTSVTSTEVLMMCDERGYDDSAQGVLISITGRGNVVRAEDSGQNACL